MDNKWKGVGALLSVPSELKVVIQEAEEVINVVNAALQIVITALNVLAKAEIAAANLEAVTINTAVAAINSALNSLLSSAGLYLLPIPIRPKKVIPTVVAQALTAASFPNLPGIVDNAATALGVVAAPTLTSPGARTYYTNSANALGGNAGYLRTVVESLADNGDANRPQLDNSQYVYYFALVAGAPIAMTLANLLATLTNLFQSKTLANGLAIKGLPVPKDLRIVYTATGVLLEWSSAYGITSVPQLDTNALVDQYVILRSTSPRLCTCKTYIDAVPGQQAPTKGLVTGFYNDVTVVSVVDVDPTNVLYFNNKSVYYDTSTLDTSKRYYYAVVYRTKTGTIAELKAGKGTTLNYNSQPLSNVVMFYHTGKTTTKSSGVAPDWIRTKSLMDSVPALAQLLQLFEGFLTELAAINESYASVLATQISLLQAEVDAYVARITAFNNLLAQLLALTTLPVGVGLYVHSAEGVGGNNFLINDLTDALSNTADTSRPPFDNNEYVAGSIVMITGPSLSVMAPTLALLKLLFDFTAQESTLSVAATSLGALSPLITSIATLSNLSTLPTATNSINVDSQPIDINPAAPVPAFTSSFNNSLKIIPE